jgi:hypothetical protein
MSAIAAPRILVDVATSTWHRRLGHPGLDALSSLSRSSFISYTSTTHVFCHACQLTKHTRLPFFSSSSAEKVFDLLHLDLWTSSVVSVFGSKYYLVILDDFTHYLWIFSLKQKSDTFTTLSNFFAYVATQSSCTVKAIQCDNGREFNNSSTWTFLLSKGIQLWMSCPYTSPQNGKAEHIIRTIINVICTLLIQASLPGRYWTEGLHNVVYLLNHLPMKTISAVCPHVTLFGSTPSYEHLCVIGCACYPNIVATASSSPPSAISTSVCAAIPMSHCSSGQSLLQIQGRLSRMPHSFGASQAPCSTWRSLDPTLLTPYNRFVCTCTTLGSFIRRS